MSSRSTLSTTPVHRVFSTGFLFKHPLYLLRGVKFCLIQDNKMEFKVYGWVLTFMPAARLQEIQAGGSNLHPCPPKQDNQGAQCERMQHRTDHVFLLWYLKQMREKAKDELSLCSTFDMSCLRHDEPLTFIAL